VHFGFAGSHVRCFGIEVRREHQLPRLTQAQPLLELPRVHRYDLAKAMMEREHGYLHTGRESVDARRDRRAKGRPARMFPRRSFVACRKSRPQGPGAVTVLQTQLFDLDQSQFVVRKWHPAAPPVNLRDSK
jgi:hypothetical protein